MATTDTDTRQSWEIRSVKFVLRAAAALLFIAYLFIVSPAALTWVRKEWVLRQPLETLSRVAEESIAQDAPKKLLQWISLRPEAEREEIIKRLEPYTGKISSYIFLNFSNWAMQAGRPEEAVFWRQYGLYRLRYDALRCGAPNSVENMTGLLVLISRSRVQGYLNQHPDIVEKSVRDVLAYDERHPAENNPTDTCYILQKIESGQYVYETVDREKWPGIRLGLRASTEYELEKAEKDKKKRGGEKPPAQKDRAPKDKIQKD